MRWKTLMTLGMNSATLTKTGVPPLLSSVRFFTGVVVVTMIRR